NWNLLSNDLVNLLRDLTGINVEYNQSFYLIRYPKLIENKLKNFYSNILSISNSRLANILFQLYSSNITILNIFQAESLSSDYLILKTRKSIDEFYPLSSSYDLQKPINDIDKNFLMNQFGVFNSNTNRMMFLTKNLTYYELSIAQQESLNKIIEINSENDWSAFIEAISFNYKSSNYFLNELKKISPVIFDYKLIPNNYGLQDSLSILRVSNSSYCSFNNYFILGYLLLFFSIIYIFIKRLPKP
ncbi:MAG: hypothetical protein K2I49_00225, partial [Ureaplasma sp.]|nr:hypothetical protein [Ureaplasma sp.]